MTRSRAPSNRDRVHVQVFRKRKSLSTSTFVTFKVLIKHSGVLTKRDLYVKERASSKVASFVILSTTKYFKNSSVYINLRKNK